jgi:hypothetical protein
LTDTVQPDIAVNQALSETPSPRSLFTLLPILTDPAQMPIPRQLEGLRVNGFDMAWLNPEPPATAVYDPVAAYLEKHAHPGDTILIIPASRHLDWLYAYSGHLPETGFVFEHPLSAETARYLSRLAAEKQRVWLITTEVVAGNVDNGVEYWLAENAYAGVETWIGGVYRIIPYTFSTHQERENRFDQTFGADGIMLKSASIELVSRSPDDAWLNIRLSWQTAGTVAASYTGFVQLLDASGALVAQQDGLPMAGYAPTTTWQPDTLILDRRSLILPPQLDPGDYCIIVGLYDLATGERLKLSDGSDSLLIDILRLD